MAKRFGEGQGENCRWAEMKHIKYILPVLLLTGCTFMLEQSERELRWTETARQTARNQYRMTTFQVEALKAFLGPRLDMLPADVVKAINDVGKLSLNVDPNDANDVELGRMYGLRARIFCETTIGVLSRLGLNLGFLG